DKISGEWGAEPTSDKRVRIIRTTNFTNRGEINFANIVEREITDSKVNRKKLKNGDIIIEKSGGSPTQPVGRVVFFEVNDGHTYLCNNFTSILRPSEKVSPKYLFYSLFFLHQKNKTLNYQNKTTGIINLQLDRYLETEEIPLPSLEDQKRIVKILDAADALRQKRKQAITLLDDYLKSIFLDMFGDPSTNPKGWERKKIGDYFLVQGGFAFKSSDYRQNGIKLVKIANVHFEDLTWDPIEYVSEQLLERQSEFLLKQNDFLIALTRPIIQSLGVVKTATVKQDDLPCLLNQRVARFKAKKISLNPEFLKYFCYSPFFKRMVEYYSTSALQPNISTKEVEEILIFNPPKELQNHFSAIARKTESIKHKMLIQSQELEMGFQALMQKAFKGEL
ncbi:MAG: restriction endonuclease subunit S, partial [Chitinophagia bacterium]|nr:restriction endonuclease subunit S [Chitinophagia bacterium]